MCGIAGTINLAGAPALGCGLDAFGLQNMGSIAVNLVGTYLDKLETKVLNDSPAIDCAGLYGSTCSTLGGSATPNPKWRHKLRLTWNTPYDMGWFGNLVNVGHAQSSGAGGLVRQFSTTSFHDALIDDNSYTYYVEVVNCAATIDPIGVQVTYTTP